MTNDAIESISSGCDWISATMTEDKPMYREWRQNAHMALYEIARQGNEVKQRALLGYVGISAGNCFVGDKEGETFVQFTGANAQTVYDDVICIGAHYSRIDIQTTIKYVLMDNNQGKKEYRRAMRYNAALPKGRRRAIDLWLGSSGGDTVYIGAASSSGRGVIYNKEVQSEDTDYTRSWRYEVKLRNELCDKWLNAVYPADMPLPERCVAFCVAFFIERGIDLHILQSREFTIGQIAATVPSDADSKLKWLATQVVPTINWLADMGYEYDLRELFYRITNDSHYPSCSLEDYKHRLDKVW